MSTTKMSDLPQDMAKLITQNLVHDPIYQIKFVQNIVTCGDPELDAWAEPNMHTVIHNKLIVFKGTKEEAVMLGALICDLHNPSKFELPKWIHRLNSDPIQSVEWLRDNDECRCADMDVVKQVIILSITRYV